MTVGDFRPFVERMISRYEGGYGWDSKDPGGPTKYGITCYDLAQFLNDKMDSMARWAPIVKAMALVTADEIYEVKYATACDFNGLDPGKDCAVFDFGVNSGTFRAIKFAQGIVKVTADGILGPVTLAAINTYDPRRFINGLCDARLNFLRGLSIWDHFGIGWGARVHDLRVYALNLAYPPMKAELNGYTDKLARIPFAYGKGYSAADMPGR